jgi:hypothetical protein
MYNVDMIRAGLTLWFGVMTLLGPDVCCCSMQRFMSTSLFESARANAATNVKRSCCAKDSPERQANNPGPLQKHAPNRCPCKERARQLTAAPALAGSGADGSVNWRVNSGKAEQMPAFRVALDATTSSSTSVRIVPFRNVEDILFVMHIMRC